MFSRIYEGRVFHQRTRPKKHRLAYRVFSFLFDIDELPNISKTHRFFSHNKFNLFSFWDRDHGPSEGRPLRPYVENILASAEIETDNGPIRLLCYPRLFGYVFNPLSVYYCYDRSETLRAIIYEVSNTFGERHSYVIEVGSDSTKIIHQRCDKEFYVSPFMEMDCSYHFSMRPPADDITVMINQTDAEGTILKACFSGAKTDMTDRTLLGLLARYPLMTLKVMVGIHWEALKLWRKGLKLVQRPDAPESPVTYVKMETKS
ncbi:DUF1365 domain-containing protein [Terasakiella sp. A23]|uniref:DUF1365 domain-containing protein n=1 Tax=Terasakiella sp. FCG-A23 TaxID=3080561 RepID=UPI002955A549|nr:DUF1365 domain-containing protein [Terasakiella sp. A23]MDV7341269.1 DUF1365 domain-containing protein [Terasakiella sp. A23]